MAIYHNTDIVLTHSGSIATVGMFDGVHRGHRHLIDRLLKEAKARRLHPIVVTFERHPRLVLGRSSETFAPLCDAEQRFSLIQSQGELDVIALTFSEELSKLSACRFFSEILMARLSCRALLLGYDNMFGNRLHNDFDLLPQECQRHDVALLHDDALLVQGGPVSSTRIRQSLADGDVALASLLLGRPYCLSGTVVAGRAQGRMMGYPTANMDLETVGVKLPCDGVYAVTVTVQGRANPLMGMAHLGPIPTFDIDRPMLEVHLFDFEGTLYGQTIDVTFHRRLRDIVHFDNAEQLRRQLSADRQLALQCLRSI